MTGRIDISNGWFLCFPSKVYPVQSSGVLHTSFHFWPTISEFIAAAAVCEVLFPPQCGHDACTPHHGCSRLAVHVEFAAIAN
jgi:hypothetical protein